MKKTELQTFITNVNAKETQVNELLKQKIQEFMKAQDDLKTELYNLMQEFFPEDIENLLREYQAAKGHIYSNDDLWISASGIQIEVKLNPYRYAQCFVKKGEIKSIQYFCGSPSSIVELSNAYKQMELYKKLRDELKEKIEDFYEALALWKEEKLNMELELLNSMKFDTEEKKNPRYRVTITIEEIQEG